MKKIICALSMAVLLCAAGARLAYGAEDWRVFPSRYDGVSVAVRAHYFPYDCEVNWRFTNHNSYPVKIEIYDKIYVTNYGEKSIPENYHTQAELKPGETKSMLSLGDHLSYGDEDFGAVLNSRGIDKNKRKVALFVVEGLKRWNYKVTKLGDAAGDETSGSDASGGSGSKANAPQKAASKTPAAKGGTSNSKGRLWWCGFCDEERRSESEPDRDGCSPSRPAWNDGKHLWHDYGYTDENTIWSCRHCRQERRSESKPDMDGCPIPLQKYHDWWVVNLKNEKPTSQSQQPQSKQAKPEQSKPEPSIEKGSWLVFPKQYDGVTIAIKFDYLADACNVSWKFTNNNAYPVSVNVANKVYSTNYGSYTISGANRVSLNPKSSKTFTERIPYNAKALGGTLKNRNIDSGGSEVTPFEISSLSSWECSVTRTKAAQQSKPKSGGRKQNVPADAKTTRRQR